MKINGSDMPTPSKMYVVRYPIQSKGDKNAAGQTVRDRVAVKRRIECEWAYITNANLATLLSAMSDIFFTVNYFDPYDNALKTITCEVGEQSMGVYRIISGTPVWTNTKMTLTEQ
jgi:hypothetical protein